MGWPGWDPPCPVPCPLCLVICLPAYMPPESWGRVSAQGTPGRCTHPVPHYCDKQDVTDGGYDTTDVARGTPSPGGGSQPCSY